MVVKGIKKKSEFCRHNKKKEEKDEWKAIVMARRGGEGGLVQKVPSGIAQSAVIGRV